MEAKADELAQYLVQALEKTAPSNRILVGLAGIPASGKTSFARAIVDRTNELYTVKSPNTKSPAILIGLDGWHLTRAQLDALPDPREAHARRGIHWTFDPISYASFLRALRQPIAPPLSSHDPTPSAASLVGESTASIVTAPTFEHSVKDPVPNSVRIHPHHRIVLIEGLYVLLTRPGWLESAKLLDERWYLRINIEDARRRLIKRHVQTGITPDEAEATLRADENDMPNGVFLIENMLEPTKIIDSVEDLVLAEA